MIHKFVVIAVFLLSTQISLSSVADHGKKNDHAQSASHHAVGLHPDEAYKIIKEGNERFANDKMKHQRQDEKTRKELSTGQKPHTIILSCSDSRVSPELVFDQGLGEIFSVRVAGNVVNPDGLASIEYAVEHLGSRLIVVLGHESCGAVKAAMTTKVGESTGSSYIDFLITKIRPNVESYRELASTDSTLNKPVWSNVKATTKNLTDQSKILRQKVEKGELKIVQGVYSLASGKVEFR